jgi:hypothetical protein
MIVQGDQPVAGLYALRLVKGGIEVAVRIWHGLPVIDGEEQDRAPRWCVEIDGRTDRWERDDDAGYRCRVPLDVSEAWPFCARRPITPTEFAFLQRRATWAREHAPNHPAANPRERIDVRSLPARF